MDRMTLAQLKRNPSVSYALKYQIECAEQRDCLDALRDAELLLAVCQMLCREAGLAAA